MQIELQFARSMSLLQFRKEVKHLKKKKRREKQKQSRINNKNRNNQIQAKPFLLLKY